MKFLTRLLPLLLLMSAFPAVADDLIIDNKENWQALIDVLYEDMTTVTEKLVKARELSDLRLIKITRDCARAEKRLSELKFLLWSQGDDAMFGISISLYHKQIFDLKKSFSAEFARYRDFQTQLNDDLARFIKLRDMLKNLNPDYIGKTQLERKNICFRKLDAAIKNVQKMADDINVVVPRAEKLRQDLEATLKAADRRNDDAFGKMMFAAKANFISVLPTAHISFYFWVRNIDDDLAVQIPDEPSFWKQYLWFAAVAGCGLLLLGRYLIKHLLKMEFIAGKYKKYRLFMFGWVFLTLAALLFSAGLWLGIVEFSLFSRVGVFCLSLAVLTFARGIRLEPEHFIAAMKLYLPLVLLYAVGMMFWTLSITCRPLIILWPLLSLPAAAVTVYVLCKQKMLLFDRVVGGATVIVLLSTAIAAGMGYAYFSLTAVMTWYLTAVGIQAGLTLTWLSTRIVPDSPPRKIALSFIMTIMVPLIWITIVGILAYWTAVIFNSQEMLEKSLVSNLFPKVPGFAAVKVSIKDILCCLIAGLMLFFVIATAKNVVRIIYQEKAETGLMASFLTLGNYLAWMFYLLFVLVMFNVDYSSILIVLGGMSMGLGFGLRDLIENFICGVILLIGKEVRPGDVIEFDGVWGVVQQISIRAAVIRTFDNAIINLPNTVVVSKNFKNWTLNSMTIRRDIKVGVAYGSDIGRVRELLLDIAARESAVLKVPAPCVLFMDFGDSALLFYLRVWLRDLNDFVPVESAMRETIAKRFEENGIVIAYPQLDVHLNPLPLPLPLPPGTGESRKG